MFRQKLKATRRNQNTTHNTTQKITEQLRAKQHISTYIQDIQPRTRPRINMSQVPAGKSCMYVVCFRFVVCGLCFILLKLCLLFHVVIHVCSIVSANKRLDRLGEHIHNITTQYTIEQLRNHTTSTKITHKHTNRHTRYPAHGSPQINIIY